MTLPTLPEPPTDFGKPVTVPRVVAGMDARVALARRSAALAVANLRLLDDAAFYCDVRQKFSSVGCLSENAKMVFRAGINASVKKGK